MAQIVECQALHVNAEGVLAGGDFVDEVKARVDTNPNAMRDRGRALPLQAVPSLWRRGEGRCDDEIGRDDVGASYGIGDGFFGGVGSGSQLPAFGVEGDEALNPCGLVDGQRRMPHFVIKKWRWRPTKGGSGAVPLGGRGF